MKNLFRLRPRRVVAAIAVLGGMVVPALGAVTSPADAACTKVGVYKYHSRVGKAYQLGGPSCVGPDMGWSADHYDVGVLDDGPPSGTWSGAGVDVWLASPV